MTRETVLELIAASVDDVVADRPSGAPIVFSENLPLLGSGSPLDSLDFVNLLATLENRLEVRFGTTVNLAESMLDEQAGHPFRSVAALADHLLVRGLASK